jgi:thiol:disulfide interchange protein
MKKFLLTLLTVFTLSASYGQMVKPTVFSMVPSKTQVAVGDIVELTINITPNGDRHIYSEKTTCGTDEGSLEAELTFTGSNFELVGKAVGVGDVMKVDETAELDGIKCNIGVFKGNAVFKQKIKVKGDIKNLVCAFYGQQCNESGCVPISIDIPLKAPILVSATEGTSNTTEPTAPADSLDSDTQTTAAQPANMGDGTISYKAKSASDVGKCTNLTYKGSLGFTNDKEEKGLWLVFWLALTSGLVALLTPCVFPMIPMTVSFFIKNKDRKKAIRDGLIFAVSIILIYVVLGTVVAFTFGANAANWLSTHWIPNVFFFAIFVVFAASFFGAFEIVLPSSWVNAMDRRADKGGFTGPIFMAFTIALVSFSCTGPIVGTVLIESAKGGIITPVISMLGFSLAFALPFGLLVIFPSYLSSLPKSGGWLNSVKVVLGFVELAFALKFLSTADQTYHWHILDREVYLALWIVIFTLLGIYLLGKLKFSHDSDVPYLSVPRLFLSIGVLSFVVYMIPGLWGAPLKALAGYLPPMGTQDFDIRRISQEAAGKETQTCTEAKYADVFHMPHGLQGYFDYEQALACAAEQNKPLFIDFTGHGCVNCRRMEEKVWSDPTVLKILKEKYVVVSLYVDDKKVKLPESEIFTAKSTGKKVTLLGDKNAEIQACYFNSNSQPMYVLMHANQTLLQNPGSAETFDYDPKLFANFLKNGLTEYNKIKP